MAAEARAFVSRLPRNPTERRAALTTALADLPERGAIAPRRVLEEALTSTPTAPSPKPKPTVKESKALTAAKARLELARAAGASPESLAIIEARIEKLTPKKPGPPPVPVTATHTPRETPSPAVSPAPVPETPPSSPPVSGWTPESASAAVQSIVQAEFDKGRTPREIQGLMWEQMTTLSPSRDKVLFGALTAAMRELEAYR